MSLTRQAPRHASEPPSAKAASTATAIAPWYTPAAEQDCAATDPLDAICDLDDWLFADETCPADWWGSYASFGPEDRRAMVFLAAEEGALSEIMAEMVEAQAAYTTELSLAQKQLEGNAFTCAATAQDPQRPAPGAPEYGSANENPTYRNLSPAAQENLMNRGIDASLALVDHVGAHHPEIGLELEDLALDFEKTDDRKALAYTENDGVCVLGESAVKRIEADPDSMVPIVVHEMTGHREMDNGTSLLGTLISRATALLPSGVCAKAPPKPWTTRDSYFDYLESELGAVARGLPWRNPYVEGLARRFSLDPRRGTEAADLLRQQAAPGLVGAP